MTAPAYAIAPLACAAVALAVAALLVAKGPRSRPHLLLALALVLVGLHEANDGVLLLRGETVAARELWASAWAATLGASALALLAFLGAALDAPPARPLRHRAASWALVALALPAMAAPFVAPGLVVRRLLLLQGGVWYAELTPAATALGWTWQALFPLGLAGSVWALVRGQRAGWLVAGFATATLGLVALFFLGAQAGALADAVYYVGYPVVIGAAAVLLAVGGLRAAARPVEAAEDDLVSIA